jgi:hypothetical protein
MVTKKTKAHTYRVSQIDVDGDGIPDGDLIEEIDSKGVVVKRKFVSSEVLQKIVSDTKLVDNQSTKRKNSGPPPKRFVSDAPGLAVLPNKKMATTQTPYQPNVNQLVVADNTSLGSELKRSFTWGIGMSAGQMLVEGVVGLFTGE